MKTLSKSPLDALSLPLPLSIALIVSVTRESESMRSLERVQLITHPLCGRCRVLTGTERGSSFKHLNKEMKIKRVEGKQNIPREIKVEQEGHR